MIHLLSRPQEGQLLALFYNARLEPTLRETGVHVRVPALPNAIGVGLLLPLMVASQIGVEVRCEALCGVSLETGSA
jgi:hypothetical protein